MRRPSQFLAPLVAVLLSCVGTTATTLERLSVERMAVVAQFVVRARCISNSSVWDKGEIWTFTRFQSGEVWKGDALGEVTVRLLGGTVGSLTSHVSGVPRFRVGEEVILFLEPTSGGDFTVVSWEQGTFRIGRDQRSGMEVVTQDTAAFETFDPRTRVFSVNGIRRMSVDAFRARVQSALAAGREPMP
jgi:hypothetical protein